MEIGKVVALRRVLHGCPELAGREGRTMAAIRGFLTENTSLVVEDRGGWLLASHLEGDAAGALAFRADMDAIPGGSGARHGCGHDGHCAILCALALLLEGARVGANVYLIFQGAEETGEGARRVLAGFPELRGVRRIYGLHNIPGFPKGLLLARAGCFACASEGLVVDVTGRPAHAAYPGQGANPAALLSRLVLALPGMIEEILDGGERLLMHTVVGMKVGGEDFGLSAADGRLCLTLRGHRQADIDALAGAIETFVRAGCAAEGMACRFSLRDVFPDTTDPAEIVDEAVGKWSAAGLPVRRLSEPMRWSEDFGWYLKEVPGMFFGVGIGEDHPGLHTEGYCFDDGIIRRGAEAFFALTGGELG